MNIKERTKQDLIRCIERLQNQSFDECDILILMISLRPYFKQLDIIWEIACSIAHVEERDRGICHTSIDKKYARLIHTSFKQYAGTPNIDINKIEKNTFDAFVMGSIDDCDELNLISQLKINKNKAKKIVSDSYVKKDGYYVLRKEYSSQEKKQKLVNIFILATSQTKFDVAIDNNDLIKQLTQALEDIVPHLGMGSIDIAVILEKNKFDIIVCIMCLLHSSAFTLYDKTVGRAYLSLFPKSKISEGYSFSLTGEVPIKLSKVSFALMVLEGDVEKYFPSLDFSKPVMIKEFSIFNAIRDDKGGLIIGKRGG